MGRILVDVFNALVVSSITIVLAVSFSSIVYTGPLQQFLAAGIGTTMLAAAIAMFVGTFFLSHKGTIVNPQDLTAILLAGAAISIAAQLGPSDPDVLFATVLATIATAAAVTGLSMFALGYFGLGNIIRYIPYPVMGGFLASTGYLLVIGAIGTLLETPVTPSTLATIFQPDVLVLWLPWIVGAIGLLVATRKTSSRATLPISIVSLAAFFYVFLFVTGNDMNSAAENGWLLGPFPAGGLLTDVRPTVVFDADFSLVMGQSLTFAAVVIMAVIGSGLNLSGLELEVGEAMDTDRDFRAVGLSGMLAAPTGGLIAYPGIAASVLTHKFASRGKFFGLAVTAGYLVTAVAGAGLLELLPAGLFAATIGYLGFDLLLTWVWHARRRLILTDYCIILVILSVSIIFGFLEALAVGLVGSILIFVISYSRQNSLRLQSDLARRNSTSERELTEIEIIRSHGQRVRIFEFTGYLFFGTAKRLKDQIDSAISHEELETSAVVLDFTRVQGIDASAAQSLNQIVAFCGQRNIRVLFSGMSAAASSKLHRFLGGVDQAGFEAHNTLDSALQAEEDRLLTSLANAGKHGAQSFAEVLQLENPDFNIGDHFDSVEVREGEYLFRAGDNTSDMYLMTSGVVRVTVPALQSSEVAVSRLQTGALIGEIAYFGENRRSAAILAETDATFLKISKARLDELRKTNADFVVNFLDLAARYMARRLDRSTQQFSAVLD